MKKKILSVLLAIMLVFSVIPMTGITAFADAWVEEPYETFGEWKYRKLAVGNSAEIAGYTGKETDIEIPSEINGYAVRGIGENAFFAYDSLKSVIIPDGVEFIKSWAFGLCSLNKITLPASIEAIDYNAFENCRSLSDVTFYNDGTGFGTINFSVFGSAKLNVIISDGATRIDRSTFLECTSLTSVTIPDSVTKIASNTFDVYTSLQNIYVGSGNENYCDIDGALFNKEATELICCPDGKSGSYTIPNSVTSIGNYAFDGCTSLTSITIPDSVTDIGNGAFYGCTSLQNIYVDADNKNYCDINGVLFNKDATEIIYYPRGKNGDYTISDSVTSIGRSAFSGCESLTSVTIGNGVTSIDDYTFYNCVSLKSVTISDSVTSIGYSAFSGCKSLTSVTIPNGVTSIDDYTFYNCVSLKSVTISDSVTSIGYSAFSGCKSLTSVTIPNSVISIGGHTFEDCVSLTSVTIPDGVTYIDDCAFKGCTSLTSVTIPDGVMNIGTSAFYNTAYYNNTSNWENGVLYIDNCLITAKDTINGEYVIKPGTKVIADYAFGNCTSLTSVTIPDSVTSIGDEVFRDCTSLTSITIGSSVTSIGWGAFMGCTSLQNIYVGSGNENYCDIDGILFNKEATKLICCPSGKSGSYTIPNSVTSIGQSAFSGCKSLTSVTIPDSVACIEHDAFYSCPLLSDVTLYNNGNGLSEYSNMNLPSSAKLNVIISDGVTSIDSWAFRNYTSLTSITIPDSVTSIGESAFYNTAYYNTESNWENGVLYVDNCLIEAKNTINGEYSIKSGTRVISDDAFFECTSLTSVTIPDSVTSIGGCAFCGCTSLTSLTIPDSVTSIGWQAFNGCTSLSSSITIPDGVTSIGEWTFAKCTSLTSITIPGSVTQISSYAFNGCENLTIYGYSSSAAETHANLVKIPFIALDAVKNTENDISIIFPNKNMSESALTLEVNKLDTDEKSIKYNITLNKNGELIQPESAVTVKIPVPANMNGTDCKVYREEADGSFTDMNAVYEDGYMVFTTDHFSVYMLTTGNPNGLLGDVNGDEIVDAADAVMIQRYDAGLTNLTSEQLSAGDVNGDGIVDAADAVKIQRYDAGLIDSL